MRSYLNLSKISKVRSHSPFITYLSTVHCQSVPTVIVFTQYDRLVKTKRGQLKKRHPYMEDHTLDSRSVEEASKVFEKCLQSLGSTMRRLKIQMPPYARVSGIFVPCNIWYQY
jgi:hypothetical protein